MIRCELFLGRCQPFHLGHKKIIDAMTNPLVVIVKGSKSSNDKERNPFPVEYQEEMIKRCCPNVIVSISPNGFLPGIIGYLRDHGYEITKVYCGADRIEEYKRALAEKGTEYNVSFVETKRLTSASAVRKSIREGDFETFKTLMPECLWGEFTKMQKEI